MRNIKGRTAFITGAASGIGLGIARACVNEGMNVALADIDVARVQAAALAVDPSGTSALPIALDIRDGAGWARAAETATQKFGAVHLLCNNAGISPFFKPVEEIEEDAWRLMLDVTLTGAFLGVRTFLPRMKAHGEGGHIVNVASMCGLDPQPGMADYDAAKFGVVGLSEAIRDELAPVGIGVSVLCPGPVRTSLWRTSRKVRGLPDTEAPPSQAGSASPDGRDPDWVGRRVMRGVIDNELYIFTHPERLRDIDRRFETIRAGFEATTAHLALDPIS